MRSLPKSMGPAPGVEDHEAGQGACRFRRAQEVPVKAAPGGGVEGDALDGQAVALHAVEHLRPQVRRPRVAVQALQQAAPGLLPPHLEGAAGVAGPPALGVQVEGAVGPDAPHRLLEAAVVAVGRAGEGQVAEAAHGTAFRPGSRTMSSMKGLLVVATRKDSAASGRSNPGRWRLPASCRYSAARQGSCACASTPLNGSTRSLPRTPSSSNAIGSGAGVPPGTVLATDDQTEGRGRGRRTWVSRPGATSPAPSCSKPRGRTPAAWDRWPWPRPSAWPTAWRSTGSSRRPSGRTT